MAKLFLVPTPIGNLQDMSFRALEVLKKADFILAEDTRKTGKPPGYYNILKSTISLSPIISLTSIKHLMAL